MNTEHTLAHIVCAHLCVSLGKLYAELYTNRQVYYITNNRVKGETLTVHCLTFFFVNFDLISTINVNKQLK